MAAKLGSLVTLNASTFKILAIWASISSLVILFLIKHVVASELLFALKDLPVYIAMIMLCARWIRSRRSAYLLALIIAYALFLALNLVILNPEYAHPLANIRQIISPLMALLFFCSLRVSFEDIKKIEKTLSLVIFIVVAWGVLEVSFELWKSYDLASFFLLKGIPVDQHGLSFMFYEPMFGYRERMTSSFLDPISLGHFLATSLVYFYYRHGLKSEYRITVILCFSGLLLCMSKGAILQAFIALSFFNPSLNSFYRVLSLLVPVIFFFFAPNKHGMLIHFNGFANAIDNITLFGYGVGSVGNYAKMFSENLTVYYKVGISDTFLGSLLGQVGFFGTSFWMFLIYSVIFPIRQSNRLDLILLTSIILVSALSENTMNITSFILPAIIIALAHQGKYFYNE
ncbi:hypothetical protein [Stutzerimonas xanthomarina]|uniref:hypothetical protein n=1 Tax=Stutzerimonas xanthomarina TaxID=271420 RepID=UPI003AA7BF5F